MRKSTYLSCKKAMNKVTEEVDDGEDICIEYNGQHYALVKVDSQNSDNK